MTVPVEWLVILPALIDTPSLPVVLTGSLLVGSRLIGPTDRRIRHIAATRLRSRRAESDTEDTGDTETSRQDRRANRSFEIHSLSSPFVWRGSPSRMLGAQYWTPRCVY